MSDSLINSVFTVIAAIIGVAIIAVLVSKNSATANVIGAGGSAFSSIIGAAVNPGGQTNLSSPISIPNIGSLQ
jgi:hypothetical protein